MGSHEATKNARGQTQQEVKPNISAVLLFPQQKYVEHEQQDQPNQINQTNQPKATSTSPQTKALRSQLLPQTDWHGLTIEGDELAILWGDGVAEALFGPRFWKPP